MSELAETVEVPFIKVGNRRALTEEQLVRQPWLRGFVERFPGSFERDPVMRLFLFIEPEPHP